MKQDAFDLIQIAASQKLRIDLRYLVRYADHSGAPNQDIERQGVDLSRPFDEMRRRINVCARVRAEMQKGNVRRIAFLKRRPRSDLYGRIAFIDWHAGPNGNRDVENRH